MFLGFLRFEVSMSTVRMTGWWILNILFQIPMQDAPRLLLEGQSLFNKYLPFKYEIFDKSHIFQNLV